MSVAGPIRNLLQQQDKALYQVKQKIKEQGAKQVSKVKEKLPTPSEIKEKFKSEASAALCNANGLKKSKKAYDKLKKLLNQLKKIIDGADKALKKIKAMCDKIMSAISKILGILGKLAVLIGTLSTVVSVAKVISWYRISSNPSNSRSFNSPRNSNIFKRQIRCSKRSYRNHKIYS